MIPSDFFPAETATTLADRTYPVLLEPRLRGQDVAAAIHELSYLLHRAGFVRDVLPFYEAALDHERLCSTATEAGWAMPQALVADLERPCFALGRSPQPMDWLPGAKSRVQLVFLLAMPATPSDDFLAIDAGLRALRSDGALLGQLRGATDTGEMFDVLRQIRLPAREIFHEINHSVSTQTG
jgi:mannitol/fructose-specific phosphotransferase system IIA component (Ntr-type)